MSDEPVIDEVATAEEVANFDFRAALVGLYRSAQDFDQKHRALSLMEKVGGFVSPIKPPAAGDGNAVRDMDQPDAVATRVLERINGKK